MLVSIVTDVFVYSIRCQLNEVKTAETGDVYSLEVSFCTFQIVLEQLEPGSTVWANLDICVDVTADEVCNKKLTATLKDVPMEGPARRMEASGYLHEVVVSPSSDMHSISMHRSDEALGSEVMIHIPLLNTEYVVVGTVVITTRLDVTFFPTQNSDFDSVTLGRLNQARKERYWEPFSTILSCFLTFSLFSGSSIPAEGASA